MRGLRPPDLNRGRNALRARQAAALDLAAGYILAAQGKKGISAMDLMRKIGVSYNAAWRMKHKIVQAMMEREDEKPPGG